MSCAPYQSLFSDHFDGELAEDRRRALEEHLASCASCRAEYDAMRRSLGALRKTGPVEGSADLVRRLADSWTRPIPYEACFGRDAVFSDRFDDALPAEQRAEFDAHLEGCAGCRVDYAAYSRSLGALAAAGPVSAPFGFEQAARNAATRRALPRWILPAAAAVLVLSFGVGYLIHRSAAQADIDRLVGANEELRRRLAGGVPVIPPPEEDNIVILDGKRIPIPSFLDRAFGQAGLVRLAGGWIPRELKEHFDRGEIQVGGKWVPLADEIKRNVDEAVARQPDPVIPRGPTEAEVIAKLDLVPSGGVYLPRAYVEQLQAGKILTRDDGWRDADDMIAAIMKERRLILHEGRWMSEEQRAEILASSRVQNPGAEESALARLLDNVEIGPPLSYQELTIYPLFSDHPAAASWITLHDAIGGGGVEIADEGAVMSVKVRNNSERDLLLLAGDLLAGGRCARIVARDTLVPKGYGLDVDVYDAEPAAWRASDKFAAESGHHLAPSDWREILVAGEGQGALWAATQRTALALAPKGGGSPAEAYKAAAPTVAVYRAALVDIADPSREVVGAAVAIGSRVRFAELFPNSSAFRGAYDRILRAAALETVQWAASNPRDAGSNIPNSLAGVKQFLESALLCRTEAEGDSLILRRQETVAGRAALVDGAPAHLLVFADRARPEPDRKILVKMGRQKTNELMKEYELRFKNGAVLAKGRILDELQSLPLPEATSVLIGHLGEADLALRRRVITALGLRRDPAALPALMKTFDDVKKDAGLFAAACSALARSGDPRAADPMFRALESREPEQAKAVAEAIPELLVQIRDRVALEKAIARLIEALERASTSTELNPGGPSPSVSLPWAIQSAVKVTLGRDFGSAAEIRLWWNKEENRKKFLDDRTK